MHGRRSTAGCGVEGGEAAALVSGRRRHLTFAANDRKCDQILRKQFTLHAPENLRGR